MCGEIHAYYTERGIRHKYLFDAAGRRLGEMRSELISYDTIKRCPKCGSRIYIRSKE